jgi:hypothetical protein
VQALGDDEDEDEDGYGGYGELAALGMVDAYTGPRPQCLVMRKLLLRLLEAQEVGCLGWAAGPLQLLSCWATRSPSLCSCTTAQFA